MAFLPKKNQPRQSRPRGRQSPVTSYYRSKPPADQASPFKPKTPKRKARKYLFGFLDIVILILLLGGIGYSLMVKPDASVLASSTSFHSLAAYKTAVDAQLGHFSNRNKITFNEQSVASNLQKQFPEITGVQIELPLFSPRPTVRLSVAGSSFVLNSSGNYYIINSAGRAVLKIVDLPANAGLPIVQDTSGFKTTLGTQVLSADSVAFINSLVAECRRASVPIASLTLPVIPQELDLRTKDQAYFVKFYLGGDVLTQTGQFLAARQHFKQTGQPPAQYLDVRVSGKVFYK